MANSTATSNIVTNTSGKYLDCIVYDAMNPLCDTFYPHRPFRLTPGKILSAIFMSVIIVTALIGNVFVCAAFCHFRRLRTVTNYFIISLAISDIIVAGFSMPLWLSYEVTGWENLPAWVNFKKLVSFWEILDILAGCSSIANLTAISLDRFYSIMAPLRHRTRMTPMLALVMISFCWVYSLTLALCHLMPPHYYSPIIFTFGFCLPLVVIVFSYIAIYVKFRIRSSHGRCIEGDWNLEKTILIVIGLFVLCWTPFYMFSFIYMYCTSCHFDPITLHHISGFIKWVHYSNSCCNPIVYGFFNINFKTAFWALLNSCFGNKYSDMDLAGLSPENSNSQNSTLLRHLKSLRRKLSWKRDVEESIVSNGEMNDNSISTALLAVNSRNVPQSLYTTGYQEDVSLLPTTSRESSRASDELGLVDDVSAFRISDNEITGLPYRRQENDEVEATSKDSKETLPHNEISSYVINDSEKNPITEPELQSSSSFQDIEPLFVEENSSKRIENETNFTVNNNFTCHIIDPNLKRKFGNVFKPINMETDSLNSVDSANLSQNFDDQVTKGDCFETPSRTCIEHQYNINEEFHKDPSSLKLDIAGDDKDDSLRQAIDCLEEQLLDSKESVV